MRLPTSGVDADEPRPFVPGTTGWSVADLDDPRIERLWFAQPLELIEGVLTHMPPAYFDGGYRLGLLERCVAAHASAKGIAGTFAHELDIVVDATRVVRADAGWIAPDDLKRFGRAAEAAGKTEPGRQRIYAPPSLLIECVSPGHELHDRKTKFEYYADFRVPNYWIFEPLKRSLDCFVLTRRSYRLAAAGTAPEKLAVPLFDGLRIDLGQVFADA